MKTPRRYSIHYRTAAALLLFAAGLFAGAVTASLAAESPSKAPAPSKPAPAAAGKEKAGGPAAPSTTGPAKAGPAAPVRLAYRWTEGQVLRQTSRQVQKMTSEEDPSLNSEAVVVGRIVTKVVSVDTTGTALLDEVTTYEGRLGGVDHRRIRTSRTGEVIKSEVIEGDPSTLQGGAIFVDRGVRPGDTWKTRVKGIGGGPAYFIPLDVTFRETRGRGADAVAQLDLVGRMDPESITAMLGPQAIHQGIVGVGCDITGQVVFRIASGREDSSTISLSCSLEVTQGSNPTVAATLSLRYDTTTDDSSIPSMESP